MGSYGLSYTIIPMVGGYNFYMMHGNIRQISSSLDHIKEKKGHNIQPFFITMARNTGSAVQFIKRKGYFPGYLVAIYAFVVLILTRIVHFVFKQMLVPPEGFGVTMDTLPAPMKAPLYIVNGVSILAIVFIIAGIVFALYYKKKVALIKDE